jgi:hypothetical protein
MLVRGSRIMQLFYRNISVYIIASCASYVINDFLPSHSLTSSNFKTPAVQPSKTSKMAAFLDYEYQYSSLVSLIVATISLCLYILYRLALPTPFSGIPYNESSARKLLGDVPAMLSHIKQTDGNLITYSCRSKSPRAIFLIRLIHE